MSKFAALLDRLPKNDTFYEVATWIAFFIAFGSSFTFERHPWPSITVAILAGIFAICCYFLRHRE